MAKTNSKTRANNSHSEPESDGPVREMRLDAAHQLGSGTPKSIPSPHIDTGSADDHPGGPHTSWEEESLDKAEAALVAAWDELHGPAYEKESPSLDPLAPAVDASQQSGSTSIEMLRVARTQLQQLATLLNERQAELDRRSTNTDAREAELAQDQRDFQLVLREYHESETERQAQLAEREVALAAREQALAALELSQQERYEVRADEVRQRAAALELREVRLREWEITLSQRTGQLELHEHETEHAETALAERTQGLVVEAELLARRADTLRQLLREYLAGETPTTVLIERSRVAAASEAQTGFPDHEPEWPAFVAAIRELAERRERLDRGEASLAKSEEEIARQREQLGREQANWERRKTAEQRDLDEARRLTHAEADAIREQRLSSERELETRRAAIEELHGGLILAQQELLQERLALEELVAEFGGRINSTRFTEAQLRGRQKLAELYRHQTEQLLEERMKLEELAERLPLENRRLQAQRVELEQWMNDRQDDLSGLTARLSAREQELEQIAAQLEEESRRWSRERLDYERDLRCLLTELGR